MCYSLLPRVLGGFPVCYSSSLGPGRPLCVLFLPLWVLGGLSVCYSSFFKVLGGLSVWYSSFFKVLGGLSVCYSLLL